MRKEVKEMGFRKATIALQMIDVAENTIEYVSGWLSEDGAIGFHRTSDGKRWVATDIASGARICVGDTRKECAAWCEDNKEKIEDRRLDPIYTQYVMNFKEKIRKELKIL